MVFFRNPNVSKNSKFNPQMKTKICISFILLALSPCLTIFSQTENCLLYIMKIDSLQKAIIQRDAELNKQKDLINSFVSDSNHQIIFSSNLPPKNAIRKFTETIGKIPIKKDTIYEYSTSVNGYSFIRKTKFKGGWFNMGKFERKVSIDFNIISDPLNPEKSIFLFKSYQHLFRTDDDESSYLIEENDSYQDFKSTLIQDLTLILSKNGF
jgi:hypothetical protein